MIKEYYEIKLNNGRFDNSSYYENYGYLKILPITITEEEKGFFRTKVSKKMCYEGAYYVLAEKKYDYYEDIITGKKIVYDKTGLCEGLSYGMYEPNYYDDRELIRKVPASYVADKLKYFENPKVMAKYLKELELVEHVRIDRINSMMQEKIKVQNREQNAENYISQFKKRTR